jgi:hypothetical protein
VDNEDPTAIVVNQEQADWNETDNTLPTFIKNKPVIDAAEINYLQTDNS